MNKLPNFRTRVFAQAWQIVKETGVSLAEALKDAWALVRLQVIRFLMRSGQVSVTFRKVNGEVTTRKATRNMEMVPEEKHPKHTSLEDEYIWVLPFFDLERSAWRSLKAENIISFSIL